MESRATSSPLSTSNESDGYQNNAPTIVLSTLVNQNITSNCVGSPDVSSLINNLHNLDRIAGEQQDIDYENQLSKSICMKPKETRNDIMLNLDNFSPTNSPNCYASSPFPSKTGPNLTPNHFGDSHSLYDSGYYSACNRTKSIIQGSSNSHAEENNSLCMPETTIDLVSSSEDSLSVEDLRKELSSQDEDALLAGDAPVKCAMKKAGPCYSSVKSSRNNVVPKNAKTDIYKFVVDLSSDSEVECPALKRSESIVTRVTLPEKPVKLLSSSHSSSQKNPKNVKNDRLVPKKDAVTAFREKNSSKKKLICPENKVAPLKKILSPSTTVNKLPASSLSKDIVPKKDAVAALRKKSASKKKLICPENKDAPLKEILSLPTAVNKLPSSSLFKDSEAIKGQIATVKMKTSPHKRTETIKNHVESFGKAIAFSMTPAKKDKRKNSLSKDTIAFSTSPSKKKKRRNSLSDDKMEALTKCISTFDLTSGEKEGKSSENGKVTTSSSLDLTPTKKLDLIATTKLDLTPTKKLKDSPELTNDKNETSENCISTSTVSPTSGLVMEKFSPDVKSSQDGVNADRFKSTPPQKPKLSIADYLQKKKTRSKLEPSPTPVYTDAQNLLLDTSFERVSSRLSSEFISKYGRQELIPEKLTKNKPVSEVQKLLLEDQMNNNKITSSSGTDMPQPTAPSQPQLDNVASTSNNNHARQKSSLGDGFAIVTKPSSNSDIKLRVKKLSREEYEKWRKSENKQKSRNAHKKRWTLHTITSVDKPVKETTSKKLSCTLQRRVSTDENFVNNLTHRLKTSFSNILATDFMPQTKYDLPKYEKSLNVIYLKVKRTWLEKKVFAIKVLSLFRQYTPQILGLSVHCSPYDKNFYPSAGKMDEPNFWLTSFEYVKAESLDKGYDLNEIQNNKENLSHISPACSALPPPVSSLLKSVCTSSISETISSKRLPSPKTPPLSETRSPLSALSESKTVTPKVSSPPASSETPAKAPKVSSPPNTSETPAKAPEVSSPPKTSETPAKASKASSPPNTSETQAEAPQVSSPPKTSETPASALEDLSLRLEETSSFLKMAIKRKLSSQPPEKEIPLKKKHSDTVSSSDEELSDEDSDCSDSSDSEVPLVILDESSQESSYLSLTTSDIGCNESSGKLEDGKAEARADLDNNIVDMELCQSPTDDRRECADSGHSKDIVSAEHADPATLVSAGHSKHADPATQTVIPTCSLANSPDFTSRSDFKSLQSLFQGDIDFTPYRSFLSSKTPSSTHQMDYSHFDIEPLESCHQGDSSFYDHNSSYLRPSSDWHYAKAAESPVSQPKKDAPAPPDAQLIERDNACPPASGETSNRIQSMEVGISTNQISPKNSANDANNHALPLIELDSSLDHAQMDSSLDLSEWAVVDSVGSETPNGTLHQTTLGSVQKLNPESEENTAALLAPPPPPPPTTPPPPPPTTPPAEDELAIIKEIPARVDDDGIKEAERRDHSAWQNPAWDHWKMLTTDKERYRNVRKIWKNLRIPNPKVNLTVRNLQRLNGFAPPKWQLRHIPTNFERPSIHCCSVFKELMDEKERITNDEVNSLYERMQCELENENEKYQHALLHCQNPAYNQKIEDMHFMAVEKTKRFFNEQCAKVQECAKWEIERLMDVSNEVVSFHEFYDDLDGEKPEYSTLLTAEEFQEITEINEMLLQQYNQFYR